MVGSKGARITLLKKFRRKIEASRRIGPICDLKSVSSDFFLPSKLLPGEGRPT
jgi:hypothetical protein